MAAIADASAFVLAYRDPYDYDARVLRIEPGVRASARSVDLTLRADFARGEWSSRYADASQADSLLARAGVTRIDGIGLAATSFLGPVGVEVGAALRDATNGTRDGRYATFHATLSVPIGRAGAFGTLRLQEVAGASESGADLGAMVQVGSRTTLIALLTEPVSDPLYGTRSGFGVSLGASVQLHRPPVVTGVAVVGPSTAGRRPVTLRVAVADASAVSAAGSFNGWTPVAMQRDGSHWTLTLHLEPGAYTFAFLRADGTWFVPEDAPGIIDDGFGQKNATLVVPPL